MINNTPSYRWGGSHWGTNYVRGASTHNKLEAASRNTDNIRFTTSNSYEVTTRDIERAAQRTGFYKIAFQPSFVADLATIEHGQAIFLTKDQIASQLSETANEMIFVPSQKGEYPLETVKGAKTKSLKDKRADWIAHRLPRYMKRSEALPKEPQISNKDVFDTFGFENPSPLDKAFVILRRLMDGKKKEKQLMHQMKDALGEGGNFKEFLGKLRAASSQDDSSEEDFKYIPHDPTMPLEESDDPQTYLDFLFAKQFANREGGFKKLPEKLLEDIMKVASTLRDNARISPHDRTPLEADPVGKIIELTPATGLHDMERLSPSDWGSTKRQIISGLIHEETLVETRFSRQPELSVMNVLIDRSGSMSSQSKNHKALGVLWHLVKQVILQKAVVVFSFFEAQADEFHVLDYRSMSREDLMNWFYQVMNAEFNGNGTEVGKATLECIDFFDNLLEQPQFAGVKVTNPHIILINDGQDKITLSVDELFRRRATMHGFVLLEHNQAIQDLCEATGGTYINHL